MGTVPNNSPATHANDPHQHPWPVWPPFDIDARVPGYIYVKLADYLADRITDGLLAPGAMLPQERSLGTEFGVSVGTARRAVQELRERGLVVTLPSKGTFVLERGSRSSM